MFLDFAASCFAGRKLDRFLKCTENWLDQDFISQIISVDAPSSCKRGQPQTDFEGGGIRSKRKKTEMLQISESMYLYI